MKKKKIYEKGEKLALDHWEYVGGLCKKMYIDAFIHGYKHGRIKDIEHLEEMTRLIISKKKIKIPFKREKL